jgi:hypothetical protein
MATLKPPAHFLIGSFITVLLIVSIKMVLPILNKYQQHYYDLSHLNPEVNSYNQVRSILNDFKRVTFKELPEDFKKRTGLNRSAERKKFEQHRFYAVKKQDLFRKIAGNNRLINIVSADNHFRKEGLNSTRELYFDIDPVILFRLIDILNEIKKQKLDPDALLLISGHRTPIHNNRVGGKRESRHILGDALDLKIGDLNRDGFANQKDKKLLVPILERIIGKSGGLGIYRMSVHIDHRGKRARW